LNTKDRQPVLFLILLQVLIVAALLAAAAFIAQPVLRSLPLE
jgi:hypothetical protein